MKLQDINFSLKKSHKGFSNKMKTKGGIGGGR